MKVFPPTLSFLVIAGVISGCGKLFPPKPQVHTASKDFRVDRCDMTYRGKAVPMTGTIDEMIAVLGPPDRFEKSMPAYFWDGLGIQVRLVVFTKDRVSGIEIHFDHKESGSESAFKSLGRPEDSVALKDVQATYPRRFFKGEFILEGASIDSIIDFDAVNAARAAYLKTQSGPDATLQPILQSWSNTRYAYERFCADGRHLGFLFSLISAERPFRMGVLSIASNNVPDPVDPSADPAAAE